MLLKSAVMTFFISRDDFYHGGWSLPGVSLIKIYRHMKKIAMLCAAASILPFLSQAHPGHGGHDGDGGYTIIHYFTTMPHALVMWGAVIGIALYFRHLYRREQQGSFAPKKADHARAVHRHRDH